MDIENEIKQILSEIVDTVSNSITSDQYIDIRGKYYSLYKSQDVNAPDPRKGAKPYTLMGYDAIVYGNFDRFFESIGIKVLTS